MCQNEAYILAARLGGQAYCAGVNYWRVSVYTKTTVRIYDGPETFIEREYYGN
jgi:hypothetical protein